MAETGYPCRFLNQYVQIPPDISSGLDAEFPGEYPGVRHCLGLILTNLLGYGPVAYSRRGEFYTENRTLHYTRANMLRAVDIAVESGYAADSRGFKSRGYARGVSSVLTPLERLRKKFRPLASVPLDLGLLPILFNDGRPAFGRGDLLSVASTPLVSLPLSPPTTYGAIFDDAYRLNREYFNRMRIGYRNPELEGEYLDVVGLTRMFKQGGVGRWYQKGGLSYQELPEEDRARLLLDGEPVAELDYPAMHPHILYAWEGMQCPEGFYEAVADQCGCSRFVAKSVTLFAINAPSYASLTAAINLDRAHEIRANQDRKIPKPILYDELKKTGLRPKDITDAFSKAHPAITKYLFSGSWSGLMLAESEIATATLLRLMELGIPALPVHDSIISPARHRDTVRQVMEEAYTQHTGFRIAVE